MHWKLQAIYQTSLKCSIAAGQQAIFAKKSTAPTVENSDHPGRRCSFPSINPRNWPMRSDRVVVESESGSRFDPQALATPIGSIAGMSDDSLRASDRGVLRHDAVAPWIEELATPNLTAAILAGLAGEHKLVYAAAHD